MAKKEQQKKADSNLSEIESALTQTEQFIETNQKTLTIVVGVAVALVALYFLAKTQYFQPRENNAQEQMFQAQFYFEKDSFNLAVNGDGNNLGFLDIIDEFGMTKAANLAKYYAGVSYLHLGQYEDAIEWLSKFRAKDDFLAATAIGCQGDAYASTGDTDKALAAYRKAAGYDNELTAPIYLVKCGALLESSGKNEEALKAYQTVKDKYPQSAEGRTVDKNIARLENLSSK
jgi:tetratricopeptide (TPR) repeat protein